MDIKINLHGMLEIKRTGEYITQFCPFKECNNCGDHCPLFGEPIFTLDHNSELELCQGKILKGKINDKRAVDKSSS